MSVPSSSQLRSATGGRLVATDGRVLPLTGTSLKSEARAGVARTTLEQHFKNPYAEPLTVTYLLPLPAEGAVSGFAFRIGERRVVGHVDRRATARDAYAKALAAGRTAALLESERDTIFTQEIGNIPPGVEVVAEIVIDQKLRWLSEGSWEWRFPTVVAPRYLGEEGRVADAGRVAVDVSETPLAVRGELALRIGDALRDGDVPFSPSHEIRLESEATTAPDPSVRSALVVTAADLPLDRDIVIRWPVALGKIGLALDAGRPAAPGGAPTAGKADDASDAAYGLLTIVPPLAVSDTARFPRDLIVLLDTSGSMAGKPIDAARRIAAALVESLDLRDTLELIAFANVPERWRREAVPATDDARADALSWLASRQAGGSTEMRAGITAALAGLRPDAARQVVLVTDGCIGFESEIVAAVLNDLPAGSHLHTVGIGAAPNRSLTAAAARAGRGIEVLAGVRGEDPADAARRLLEATSAPLLADVAVGGSALLEHAPRRIHDLHGAAPALVSVKVRPEGGELVVHGRTPRGSWRERVQVPALACGAGSAAVAALFGREVVADLEMRRAAGEPAVLDVEIERLGLSFRIATRMTSWIAVSEEVTVDSTRPFRREIMPHNLPQDLSAEGLGLGVAGGVDAVFMACDFRGPIMERADSYRTLVMRKQRLSREDLAGLRPDLLGKRTPRPRLIGRITLLTPDALTVEIEVDAGLDWNPGHVGVHLMNGKTVPAEVVERESTAPGRVKRGMTLRLTLRLHEPLDPDNGPAMIVVSDGVDELTIELRDA